jgi:hypothetical protein
MHPCAEFFHGFYGSPQNSILYRISAKLHYLLKRFSAVKINLLQLNFTTASIWTGEGVQLPYLGKLNLLFIGSTFHLTI